jgi:hypothetical protein
MSETTQKLKETLEHFRKNGNSFSKVKLGVGQEFVSIIKTKDESPVKRDGKMMTREMNNRIANDPGA